MSPRLRNVTARELARALEKAGFVMQRQKGSHATYRHPESKLTTVVPMHGGDVARPLLKMILKQAGVSEAEFEALS